MLWKERRITHLKRTQGCEAPTSHCCKLHLREAPSLMDLSPSMNKAEAAIFSQTAVSNVAGGLRQA